MSPCFYSFLCPSAWTASVCKTNPTVVPHASVLPLPLETCLTAWSCYKSSPRAWFIYCHEQKDLKKKIFSNKENSCWHKENFCTLDFCTRSTASRFLIITLDYFEKEKLYPGNSGKGQGLFSTWQPFISQRSTTDWQHSRLHQCFCTCTAMYTECCSWMGDTAFGAKV